MTIYGDYLAAIDSKTFTSQYLYQANVFVVSESRVDGMTFYGGGARDLTQAPGLAGTVHTLDASIGTFELNGTAYQIYGAGSYGNSLFFGPVSGGAMYAISNTGEAPTQFPTNNFSYTNPYQIPNPTCFVMGTRIATTRGQIPVEELQIGDLVHTQDGEALPISWVGVRHVTCRQNPWARHISPVLIEADAIAPAVPLRDLMVSPGHCLALGDTWLIEAEHLINGTTVRAADVAEVTYWHVELPRHSIIFAEGAAAESFIDVGNKADFDNGAGHHLDGASIARALASYCRPVAGDRETIERLRAPISHRAELIRWAERLTVG